MIAIGGWHPAHACVLAVGGNGIWAVALVDTNGDGREIDIDYLLRDGDGRWHSGTSVGAISDQPGANIGGSLDLEGPIYCYGRAQRPGPTEVEFDGEQIQVTAASNGWWVWVRPAEG
ncbi:hypothetical protein AB0N05_06760 [Nocardia sp. NPDC051030]|uniref:hypothetical protein n=1 Tax=Nocardia sp. NPDC051030 TaxID=3155162 RepID=UPI00342DA3FE